MSGSLRFRTPHIEEIPTTQTRNAPGFAWVAVNSADPAAPPTTTQRKRARAPATELQQEALTARQQRELDRRLKDLNNDHSKDVPIPVPAGTAAARPGKTPNTKRVLASGKTFAHYLDDEAAALARSGRSDPDLDQPAAAPPPPRPSKTPIARRKPPRDDADDAGPAPAPPSALPPPLATVDASLTALLLAPPLTYAAARAAPPPAGAPPPRRFCEVCGFFGRARCARCGAMTCSVACGEAHAAADAGRCGGVGGGA